MAVATKNRSAFRQRGLVRRYDMNATADEIYKGVLINRDASGDMKVGSDTAGESLAGVATERITVPAGASIGDKKIRLFIGGLFEFEHSGLTNANIGDGAYVVDDQTVALVGTTTNDVFVGRIVEVTSASRVVVALFQRADN